MTPLRPLPAFAALAGLLLAGLAGAAAFSERQAYWIARAEQHLNGLTTMRADFTQTVADGGLLGGTFLLSRPGRLRFEYGAGVDDFITADGTWIFYWDAQSCQQSQAPVDRTLANFILRDRIALSGDLTVLDVQETEGGVQINVVQTDKPEQGELALLFTKEPFQLSSWAVADQDGSRTEVNLINQTYGVPLDREQFYFYEPRCTVR